MGKGMTEHVERLGPGLHYKLKGGARALVEDGDGEAVRRLAPKEGYVDAVTTAMGELPALPQ
jgi:hypothetical protein